MRRQDRGSIDRLRAQRSEGCVDCVVGASARHVGTGRNTTRCKLRGWRCAGGPIGAGRAVVCSAPGSGCRASGRIHAGRAVQSAAGDDGRVSMRRQDR